MPEPKKKILLTGAVPQWDLDALEDAYDLVRLYAAPDRAAALAAHGPDADAIAVSGHAPVTRAMMAACPKVRLLANYGVGYDAIDVDAATELGLKVTNTPDVLTDDCADLAVGMLLALARNIVAADHHARSGAWEAGSFPFQTPVTGARLGIVGLGRIGRGVADRMAAFGMDIAYSARAEKDTPGWQHFTDITALAARSDFLVVALAATAETRHSVDADVLSALGPKGRLINISRASNIDELALLDALETGGIAGAALDVFEGEPAINPRFKPLQNVILQPHHASATEKTRRAMGQLMRDNLAAYFDGTPLLTPVN